MVNKQKPLISIFVSVFNLENYITQCLDSILNQDFNNYELILVDNGSTDRSIEICEEYAKKYKDKIIYKKFPLPTDISRPSIYALKNATGKYFMCIDGDDYIVNGCLRSISDIINSKQPDLIMGTFKCHTEPGASPIKDAILDSNYINNSSYEDAISYIVQAPQFHFVQWRFIFSLQKKKHLRPLESSYMVKFSDIVNSSSLGDNIHVIGLLDKANSIHCLEEPFYIYRCRLGSFSSKPFSGDKAIGYITTLMIIEIIKGNKFPVKDFTNKIIEAQIRKFMYFYSNLSNTISPNGYMILVNFIEKYKKYFFNLKEYNIQKLNEIFNFIDKYGILPGLMMFTCYKEANLMNELKDYKNNDIYIFPSGVCGESTAILLKKWGVNVKGFLDNNPEKENMSFQGIRCFSPDKLIEYTDQERKKIRIVISVAYDSLIITLQNQLSKLGIDENQIIVRE